ncbi:hypothetical protein DRQ26_01850 [bacterium]|nr:MAG: hypothetical protein DRQ26_01850 [bacterium]
MNRKFLYVYGAVLLFVVGTFIFWGCDYKGTQYANEEPFVQIYGVPPDSSVLGAAPIMYWWGTDRDGRILGYEYIDIPKPKVSNETYTQLAQNYWDSPQIPDSVNTLDGKTIRWFTTESSMDTIFLTLEQGEDTTEHLFCVRSFDNDSVKSDVECMIYFRVNEPPDSVILLEYDDYPEGDTFWVLDDFTDDWTSIPISWRGHDPDNSIILEYFWWVENVDDPSDTARTSLAEDSLGGVFTGKDSTDGWVRSTNTMLKGIPTGHWRFIIQIRDDAFYPGALDTFEFYAVHPYFDPTVDTNITLMSQGNFPHKLMFLYNSSLGWNDDMWTDFYQPILEQMKNEGYIDDYEAVAGVVSGERLNITKYDMKEYSIIYLYHLGGLINMGVMQTPNSDMLEELHKYVLAGGRTIFDGRKFFAQISEFVDAYSPVGQIPFDMFGISWQSSEAQFNWAESEHPSFGDLNIDSTKVSTIGGIVAVGVYPYFYGVPYAEVLYTAGDYGVSNSIIGMPVACRFAKQTTRSAFFSFPLYVMENDEGQVTTVLDSIFSFVSLGFEEEDTTQSESLFKMWW